LNDPKKDHPLCEEVLWDAGVKLSPALRERLNEHLDTVQDLSTLFAKKLAQYGTGNVSSMGELGLFFRIREKVARLAHLIEHPDNVPAEEPLVDTIADISVLASMLLTVRKGGWVDVPARYAL